ncbi:helix-turn-helix transcriptional regulator [Actinomadura sp. NPDC047616]|uniref:helix-turn-helix transcriptional regulator n=1 Tax=Actinomadura sp. NPDC047616 TaxID=3155914 RepID=UPI0033DAD2C9
MSENLITKSGEVMAVRILRPRPGLITARKRFGLSQEQAAERVGVSPSTWARWEQGKVDPHATQRARIALAFAATLDQVASWLDEHAEYQPFPWLCEGVTRISLAATVEDASELWEWDVDPIRRGLLSALPFMPAVLSEWLLSYTLDPGVESRAHSSSNGRTVGLSDVQRVRDAYDAFNVMDRHHGSGLVRPAVVAFMDSQLKPLLNGGYTDEVGGQLMTAAATMSYLAGWTAYDLHQHGLAQAHYGQALRLAKAADDPLIAAWTLHWMACQAIDLKKPDEAVRLTRAAQNAARQANPRIRAFLILREARGTALGVDLADTPDRHTTRRVEKLIAEAEKTFAKATGGDGIPHWASDQGIAEFSSEVGWTWRLIGEHKRAEASIDVSLRTGDPAHVRGHHLTLVHRGEALLRQGELEEAIACARPAVHVAVTLPSARPAALVRDFDRHLDAHAGEPVVKEWRDYLRTVPFTTV